MRKAIVNRDKLPRAFYLLFRLLQKQNTRMNRSRASSTNNNNIAIILIVVVVAIVVAVTIYIIVRQRKARDTNVNKATTTAAAYAMNVAAANKSQQQTHAFEVRFGASQPFTLRAANPAGIVMMQGKAERIGMASEHRDTTPRVPLIYDLGANEQDCACGACAFVCHPVLHDKYGACHLMSADRALIAEHGGQEHLSMVPAGGELHSREMNRMLRVIMDPSNMALREISHEGVLGGYLYVATHLGRAVVALTHNAPPAQLLRVHALSHLGQCKPHLNTDLHVRPHQEKSRDRSIPPKPLPPGALEHLQRGVNELDRQRERRMREEEEHDPAKLRYARQAAGDTMLRSTHDLPHSLEGATRDVASPAAAANASNLSLKRVHGEGPQLPALALSHMEAYQLAQLGVGAHSADPSSAIEHVQW